ncbi:MAG: hypothetical protein OXK77_10805 [Gemmatimonadota bacterium]|nr:hypothetical protein [Gemmatimonadota bacterium]MDE2864495.1 hypothetical protein [Gemmatimonadota bacterium]MYB08206.1 hypothetical protein [Gemmatimonadota bacterium]
MKNGIITVIVSGLFMMSLFTVARPRDLAAQPGDCGYGQRHCLSEEECADFGGGWMDPITKWLFGLVLDSCVEYHYYYR